MQSQKYIPPFQRGQLLSIKIVAFVNGKEQNEQNLTGICIRKTNKGFESSFSLKHAVNGH